MPTLRARLTAALLVVGTLTLPLAASASDAAEAVDPQWQEQARAICLPRDGDLCEDLGYLQAHYGPEVVAARKTALRAATRSNRKVEQAKREVLLQYAGVCDDHVAQHCAGSSACSSRAAQICQSLKQRAAACRVQSQQFCSQQRIANCKPILARCPSSRPENIEKILARYDDLSPAQKTQIRQLAGQLKEADDTSTIATLVNTLINTLGLLAL